jgi:ribosomal protein S1
VGDELTLLVIRVDPHERRIGLSLKELAHVVTPPPETDDRGQGRRAKKGKKRDEYNYDEEE